MALTFIPESQTINGLDFSFQLINNSSNSQAFCINPKVGDQISFKPQYGMIEGNGKLTINGIINNKLDETNHKTNFDFFIEFFETSKESFDNKYRSQEGPLDFSGETSRSSYKKLEGTIVKDPNALPSKSFSSVSTSEDRSILPKCSSFKIGPLEFVKRVLPSKNSETDGSGKTVTELSVIINGQRHILSITSFLLGFFLIIFISKRGLIGIIMFLVITSLLFFILSKVD